MPQNNRFIIKVPASSANLGPGFDSMGVALDLYLTLEVEVSHRWEFLSVTDELQQLPKDETHFIGQIALQIAEKYDRVLSPCKVKMESEIPLARGLGSSAAAIVAGIELADAVGNLNLTQKEKLLLATELEGHPDNVGASLYGGLVIGCYRQNEVDMLSFTNLPFEMAVVIPPETLLTKDSREVLPLAFSRNEAVQASSTANLLVAALLSENWELAGKMMGQDLFHQPYRKPLVLGFQEIERAAKLSGAFGTALSGAGPTVICFTEKEKGRQLSLDLQAIFPEMTVKPLQIDHFGSRVKVVEVY
ncbi:homoserine kinase [Neobacillus vireti]|uniref:Homoserine kinase n=1 Tax=Neobacillus vireti LMG 21834 TaxID=1131730 RepID=A0AB94IL86_9BACI|nr:homoserine kinase [Neobacillus vireti]ETI67802.1 homoserine kinase [Neobacillus vireti LMG 21834]KLT18559.1 serine kinase [Neobacillus vireti]